MKSSFLMLIVFLFSGCATSFKAIKDTRYIQSSSDNEIRVSYNSSVLEQSGNSLYAEKARERGFDIFAVKIENTSSKPLDMKNTAQYFVGGNPVSPIDPHYVVGTVRQRTGLYSLYLLGALINGTVTETKCETFSCKQETSFIPIGIIIGPALALLNCAMSASANESFENAIIGQDLSEKTINPGENISGYLVFNGAGSAPLTIKAKTP